MKNSCTRVTFQNTFFSHIFFFNINSNILCASRIFVIGFLLNTTYVQKINIDNVDLPKKFNNICSMLYLLLSCKVRSVIRFLLTKNYNSIEVHRQLHKTY